MAMHFWLQLHVIYLLVFLAFHASSCEQEDYWQMKLPKVPMPQAIKDNLFHSKDQMSTMTQNIIIAEKAATKQPYTVVERSNDADKATINQPYTVMGWKYNEGNANQKHKVNEAMKPFTIDTDTKMVGIDQPYTVMGWKYDADNAKENVGIDQPYTVMGWKYNAKEKVKEVEPQKVGIDQPYTVMGWKYDADSDKEKVKEAVEPQKVGIEQPYTVMGWKYNAGNANKEKIKAVDEPFTIDTSLKKNGMDQPYTVMGWKYNSKNANKEKVKGMDQAYTVMGWKYNSNIANKEKVKEAVKVFTIDTNTKKVGIDQPYTVMGWKYNADNANKEKVKEAVEVITMDTNTKKAGIDQPYTVMGWKYNADSANKEKVKEAVEVITIDTNTKKANMKQPYTVMGWKYNADNANKEKAKELSSGSVFFVEKSLRLGEKLKHDFQKTSSVPFLPKHVVQSIPFSEDKITEIHALFSVKSESAEATGIKGTLDICLHRPKVEKENRTCAQSMEDVVDFVVRELGSNDVELRMMKNDIEVPKGIQDYVITKVKKLVVPGNTAAACHRMSYPYVVYYCHHQQDIGHYDVTLVSPTSGTAIQTTAVCHYDTDAWKPDVPALRYLGIRPGDAPVCHFSAINDMFWTLKANSKSLDMAQ